MTPDNFCVDNCPDIGACCRVFFVAHPSGTVNEMQRLLDENSPPWQCEFILRDIDGWEEGHGTHACSCPEVGDDGLCGDYENRPQGCRLFEPMSDGLCVLFVGPPSRGTYNGNQEARKKMEERYP